MGSRGGDERQNQFMKQLVSNQSILEGIEALSAVADEVGCSLSQLSLAWILRRDEISSCITGATRPAQIGENCAASGIQLSAEQLERIDRLIMPVTYSEDYA